MDGPTFPSTTENLSWEISRRLIGARMRLGLLPFPYEVHDWLRRHAIAWSVDRCVTLLELARAAILAGEAPAILSVDQLRRCLWWLGGKTWAAMVELAMPAPKPKDEDEDQTSSHG